MRKAVIYGAGGTGRRIFNMIQGIEYEVVAFIDTDKNKQGKLICDIPCVSLKAISEISYDVVIVGAASGYTEIISNLENTGIALDCIETKFVKGRFESRKMFLENFAEICPFRNIRDVAVAEAGVFRGEFAECINRAFPENDLYLYDTFEGFANVDVTKAELESDVMKNRDDMVGHFRSTSEEIVLRRMPFADKCIIRKGYFPDSAREDRIRFGFVSLDMDLYIPMKAGLYYFYDKMVPGGIILLDDFFCPGHPHVKDAVNDFEKESGVKLHKVPIGDNSGLAVIK